MKAILYIVYSYVGLSSEPAPRFSKSTNNRPPHRYKLKMKQIGHVLRGALDARRANIYKGRTAEEVSKPSVEDVSRIKKNLKIKQDRF